MKNVVVVFSETVDDNKRYIVALYHKNAYNVMRLVHHVHTEWNDIEGVTDITKRLVSDEGFENQQMIAVAHGNNYVMVPAIKLAKTLRKFAETCSEG